MVLNKILKTNPKPNQITLSSQSHDHPASLCLKKPMRRRTKNTSKIYIYIYIGNPQTCPWTQNSRRRRSWCCFTAALTKHRASMGRWLGKSDGYALDKSDGLAASEGRKGKKIKRSGWASMKDLARLEEERKNKRGEVEEPENVRKKKKIERKKKGNRET